jgi:flagellar hook-length control protein FliK
VTIWRSCAIAPRRRVTTTRRAAEHEGANPMINASGLNPGLDILRDLLEGGAAEGGEGFLDVLLQLEQAGVPPEQLAALLQADNVRAPADASVLVGASLQREPADPAAGRDAAASLWEELDALGLVAALPGSGKEGATHPHALRVAALAEFAARPRAIEPTPLERASSASENVRLAAVEAPTASAQPPVVETAASVRAPTTVPEYVLSTPLHQPGWGQAMGDRLSWMVRNGIQQARIHLDPPHLGPVTIAVAVKEERASVQILAQHAVTREALEAELPRLRAMLGESGFTGIDVSVSQQQGGRDGLPARAPFAATLGAATGAQEPVLDQPLSAPLSRGLVDHYA